MKDELITYDTAVLAKTKGFNELTWFFSPVKSEVIPHPGVYEVSSVRKHNNIDDWLAIPTQSLLQRWLREMHHIQVTAAPYQKVHETEPGFHWLYGYQVWKKDVTGADEFYTYESALEAGLQTALKLIPEVDAKGFLYSTPRTHKTVDDISRTANLKDIPDRLWRFKYAHDVWGNPITAPDGYTILGNVPIELGDIHFDIYGGWARGGEEFAAYNHHFAGFADGRWVCWARKIIPDAKPQL